MHKENFKTEIKRRIDVAAGRSKADLILKNATIVNVFTEELYEADVVIADGYIVAVGKGTWEANEVIDLDGKYIAPGLIDGHVHIESSMVTPGQFARTVVPRGTTTVVADPHEIANVCGIKGIEYMLEESKSLPLDVFIMLPSCVPATSFEHAGATLYAEDLKVLIDHPRVLGLGELMDFPAVIGGADQIIDKLDMTKNKLVDGHGPVIDNEALNAYVAAGVRTEHECTTVQEMINRLRLGMYVQIREGSAARNLLDLIRGVNKANMSRILFCTDDRHPEDILVDGHIDNNVRLAIQSGIPAVQAIKMASFNAAEAYHLHDRGAIAPGYLADLIIFDHPNSFKIEQVFKKGKLASVGKMPQFEVQRSEHAYVLNTVNFKPVTEEQFKIPLKSDIVRVIQVLGRSLVTRSVVRKVAIENESFKYHEQLDILPMAVIERHHATGLMGKGLVEGFGLKNGAIASTVAHDSHNIIVIGTSDAAMLTAVHELERLGGGIVVVEGTTVKASLALPIAGLMSDQPLNEVDEQLAHMMTLARKMGVPEDVDPFMTLAFLALPVIPEIKLTDMGLFDVNEFKFTTLEVE